MTPRSGTPATVGTSAAAAGTVAPPAAPAKPGPGGEPAPARVVREGALRRVADYVALTKPRIIELLLVTTVPAMVVAARGLPDGWLVAATLLGGALAAGSANAFNSVLERDLDALMRRTARRPLPRHAVAPRNAAVFAAVLGVGSFVWLALAVNVLAALLALAANAFYVVVYTVGLKRRTAHNIVIGGAAGCAPVLVAWAAVTGTVALPAWVLFAVIFLWTPPHFWALALRYREDYAAAGIPMLPVVAGDLATARQILGYSVALVACSLALLPAAGAGLLYLVAALLLGAAFLWRAAVLLRAARTGADVALPAMALFRWSISYLGLLFLAAAVDAVLRG